MRKHHKSFVKLQSKWYKRLADSGFNDIEQNEDMLKSWSLTIGRGGQSRETPFEHIHLKNKSKEEYYRLAGHFLYDYTFKSEIERIIWKDHANGLAHRKTAEKFEALKINMKRTTILDIITRLKKEMFRFYRGSDDE